MGFIQAVSPCIACGITFSYNPNRVPSIRMGEDGAPSETGTREPVCESCFALLNDSRKKEGLEPIPVHPDAYRAMPESELV